MKASDALAQYLVESLKGNYKTFEGHLSRIEAYEQLKSEGYAAFYKKLCFDFIGSTEYYGKRLLEVVEQIEENGETDWEAPYPQQKHLMVLARARFSGVVRFTYPFQECGEEETDIYTFVDGVMTHTMIPWAECYPA